MNSRPSIARHFAEAYFAGCGEHTRQAMAVHHALERMASKPLRDVDPDVPVGDLLPVDWSAPSRPIDSLDALEREMALEAELGPAQVEGERAGLADARVMKVLLGPAISSCTWESSTIRLRSIRGIINERVRHAPQACTCAERRGRRTRG